MYYLTIYPFVIVNYFNYILFFYTLAIVNIVKKISKTPICYPTAQRWDKVIVLQVTSKFQVLTLKFPVKSKDLKVKF